MPDANASFLVHATGPLEDLFAAPLQQFGAITHYDGSQSPEKFDLLVLDPRSLAGAFAESATLAKRMLDNDKPVLVLRPTATHKQALAAAGALRSHGVSESIALLIDPSRDASNKLHLALAEQFGHQAGQARLIRASVHAGAQNQAEAGPVDNLPVGTQVDPTLADMTGFIGRVTAAVSKRRGGAASSPASFAGPNPPPSNIPAGLYDVTPINIYYPIVPQGPERSGYTPPKGSIYLEGLVTIGLYYDNLSFNKPVQWLLIEHSGLFYTTGLEANDQTHIGWSIGELAVLGQNISSATIVTKQSSPNNVNNQTQYTSGSSFTVGVAAGTDGLNGNASYTIGSSQTASISDWTVLQSGPNSWRFYQQTPYNGTLPDDKVPDNAGGPNGVTALPAISKGSLAYNTQTVWSQIPANQQQSYIWYSYNTKSYFTYANETGTTKWHFWFWAWFWNPGQYYYIDWAAAWPSKS